MHRRNLKESFCSSWCMVLSKKTLFILTKRPHRRRNYREYPLRELFPVCVGYHSESTTTETRDCVKPRRACRLCCLLLIIWVALLKILILSPCKVSSQWTTSGEMMPLCHLHCELIRLNSHMYWWIVCWMNVQRCDYVLESETKSADIK